MDVDFAFLCDYAEVGNKIYALGIGFDTIMAPNVPATHPLLYVVVQFRAAVGEAGQKNLEVNLIDEDGNAVVPPIRQQINVPSPTAGVNSLGRLALAFRNVQFPKYGSYSIHVAIDNTQIQRLSLRVAPPPSTT